MSEYDVFMSDYAEPQLRNDEKHSCKKLNQVRLTRGQSLETVTWIRPGYRQERLSQQMSVPFYWNSRANNKHAHTQRHTKRALIWER